MRHLKAFDTLTEQISNIRKLFLPYMSYNREDTSLACDGNYIRDGLVLFLDGINYGGINNKWIDMKRGTTFTNNGCTLGDDCWNFSNSGTLQNTETLSYPYNTYTIEVCYDSTNTSGIIFCCKASGNIAAGLLNNKTFIMSSTSTRTYQVTSGNTNGPHTISMNATRGMADTVLMTTSSNNLWSPGTYNGIGGRSQGTYPFVGKIYAIRIYNRILSEAEMRHNQEEDIKRFLS